MSLVLATAMITSSMVAMPVFASDDTATEETADEKKDDAADDTEKPDVDLISNSLSDLIHKQKITGKLPPGRHQKAGRYCPRSREMPKKQQTCIKS